eukprot:TRINITY_DN8660_c0_g1_i4.p1 TRINITY_DN8660_c0_g1~~TRINITY_DN8660_c0_g1_i4.p1  ORF type:complete len:539 (+),score=102.56 TRINITY_DN8660_c0_g1_i4:128-1744(+)
MAYLGKDATVTRFSFEQGKLDISWFRWQDGRLCSNHKLVRLEERQFLHSSLLTNYATGQLCHCVLLKEDTCYVIGIIEDKFEEVFRFSNTDLLSRFGSEDGLEFKLLDGPLLLIVHDGFIFYTRMLLSGEWTVSHFSLLDSPSGTPPTIIDIGYHYNSEEECDTSFPAILVSSRLSHSYPFENSKIESSLFTEKEFYQVVSESGLLSFEFLSKCSISESPNSDPDERDCDSRWDLLKLHRGVDGELRPKREPWKGLPNYYSCFVNHVLFYPSSAGENLKAVITKSNVLILLEDWKVICKKNLQFAVKNIAVVQVSCDLHVTIVHYKDENQTLQILNALYLNTLYETNNVSTFLVHEFILSGGYDQVALFLEDVRDVDSDLLEVSECWKNKEHGKELLPTPYYVLMATISEGGYGDSRKMDSGISCGGDDKCDNKLQILEILQTRVLNAYKELDDNIKWIEWKEELSFACCNLLEKISRGQVGSKNFTCNKKPFETNTSTIKQEKRNPKIRLVDFFGDDTVEEEEEDVQCDEHVKFEVK